MKHLLSSFIVFLSLVANINAQSQTTNDTSKSDLIIKTSHLNFEDTYARIRDVIELNPNLTILFELDHSKNASTKGLELRSNRIILFGNPAIGTPLMQENPLIGIDLPQKIIIFVDSDNKVNVAYNNPKSLEEKYMIKEHSALFEKIGKALNKITEHAIIK